MKYLHTMVRVTDIDESLDFFCNKLGLRELSRYDDKQSRYTLVFLAAAGDEDAQIELTWNWDPEDYGSDRNFGHLAYRVDNIYKICQKLMDGGVTINRPHVTVTWRSSGHRTIFPSSCCSPARL